MKLRSNSSIICIHRHSEMSEKDLLKRVRKLSPHDTAKFEKLLHPSRKMQFLSARAALIEMDISLEEVTNMPEGKPIHPNVFISMSHTASHGAAISSSEHPCGIDIETMGRDVAWIRKRFVRPDEESFCSAYSDLHVWVAKEAALKLTGLRTLDFLSDMQIEERGDRQLLVHLCNKKASTPLTLQYAEHDGQLIGWCVYIKKEVSPSKPIII
jgi:phosphopantetheinyl transferase